MKKSVLVAFGESLPENAGAYGEVLSGAKLQGLIDPGSVQEAAELTKKLSLLKTPDGRRISKIWMFKGYELWWLHYGDFMHRFSVPYTYYKRLLEHLGTFEKVSLYKPPSVELFRYYLEAKNIPYEIVGAGSREFPGVGIFVQAFLSFFFLFWAKLRRPVFMIWTSDLFNPPYDHDFRMEFIYKEARERSISFVEFVRSLEPTRTVLAHAWGRKRPVIYSAAIIALAHWLSSPFNAKYESEVAGLLNDQEGSPEERFFRLIATHYARKTTGTIWSIKTMAFLVRFLGIKVANVNDATSRTFHEVLACKLSHIRVIGIMHGAASQYYNVSDFTPAFDAEKNISVDIYGVWSEWWREYYMKHSAAYAPEQLVVSGPIRPLASQISPSPGEEGMNLKVLFIAEQLGAPLEVIPYLEALLAAPDISLYIKFRAYRDGFEDWLKAHRPDILAQFDSEHRLYGNMVKAIDMCDVVVGSHSTAVLEALLRLKPLIFYDTKKWGDYFGIQSLGDARLFANDPAGLVRAVKESQSVDEATLRKLQHDFFGDPGKNGSAWVLDEVEKALYLRATT